MSAKFPRGGGEQTHSQPSVYKYLVNIIQSSQTPPTEERKEKNILPGPHPSKKFDK